MAYVAPSTQTTGTLITSAIWNQDVAANVAWLHDAPAVHVERSSSQSIPNVTFTPVSWSTEIFDNYHAWPGADNGKIALPEDGLYFVTFNIYWTFAAIATYRIARLREGGTTNHTEDRMLATLVSGTNAHFHNVGGVFLLAPSALTYLELEVYQATGGAVNIQPGPLDEQLQLNIQWVGEDPT